MHEQWILDKHETIFGELQPDVMALRLWVACWVWWSIDNSLADNTKNNNNNDNNNDDHNNDACQPGLGALSTVCMHF